MKPIGKILREKQKLNGSTAIHLTSHGKMVGFTEKKREEWDGSKALLSLDEQIKALESEVNGGDSISSTYSDDAEEIGEEEDTGFDESLCIERDGNGKITRIISNLELSDRIEKLPETLLPARNCSVTRKFTDFPKISNCVSNNSAKRVKFDSSSGLERTVKEMLQDYIPASAVENKAFYCRLCRFQGKNIEEFVDHRLSELHKTAEKMEKKMTYCRICRKQFNSMEQLKEHLKGKRHKDFFQKYKR